MLTIYLWGGGGGGEASTPQIPGPCSYVQVLLGVLGLLIPVSYVTLTEKSASSKFRVFEDRCCGLYCFILCMHA